MSGSLPTGQGPIQSNRALEAFQGMRRIPFPLETYQSPSAPLSAKRLLNLQAEQQPFDALSNVVLMPVPGLATYFIFGNGPVVALNSDFPGRIYAVTYESDGYHLYKIEAGSINVQHDLGTMGNFEEGGIPLMVTMAVSPNDMVVCVPPNAYTTTHDANDGLHQIGGGFPGAQSVAYLDGYYLFISNANNAEFFTSELANTTAYDALDFAYADALPNVIHRVIAYQSQVWLCGETAIEIWYDAGDADFAFRRQSGGVIQYGVISPTTIATGDGSVWWIGPESIVYRTVGYNAVRVSTHAVEQIIRNYGDVSSVFCYTYLGHAYYVINWPTRTLVYDSATKYWHERSSAPDGNGRWLANCVAHFAQYVIVGDYSSGTAYVLDPDIGTDNGVPHVLSFTSPPLWSTTSRAFMNRLQIEMEVGDADAPGEVVVEISDDGAQTWPISRTLPAGPTTHRVTTTRLGSFYERVIRVTAYGRAFFYAMDADITALQAGG